MLNKKAGLFVFVTILFSGLSHIALATSDEDICNALPCHYWDGDSCEVDDSLDTGGDVNGDCGYCQECSGGSCVDDDSAGNDDDVCDIGSPGCQTCQSGSCQDDDSECTVGCDACQDDVCDEADDAQCTDPNEPYCDPSDYSCGSVVIDSADITEDEIVISLAGTTSSTLTLELIGSGTTSHTIRTETRSSGADQTETFDITNLPDDTEFTSVKITWNGETDSLDYRIKVIKDLYGTRYNIPDESQTACQAGGTQTVCLTDASCNYTTGVVLEDVFADEAAENGTGRSVNYDYLKVEAWCTIEPQLTNYPKPAACNGKLIFRSQSSVGNGSCSVEVVEGNVAADYDVLSDLSCDSEIYIHEIGEKDIKDRCPACNDTHLDHYSGESDCNEVLDNLPTKKVIKLGPWGS